MLELIKATYYNPLKFVSSVWDWKKPPLSNTPPPPGPDKWQADVLKNLGQMLKQSSKARIAVRSGHGPGKGTLVSWLIIWYMVTRPDCKIVVTANTETQLSSKTWAELDKWHRYLPEFLRSRYEWTATKYVSALRPSTWRADAIPWTLHRTEAFAGTHGNNVMVIFDEASAIPEQIWEVAEGAMTGPEAVWAVFGNPTRATGSFFDCFHKNAGLWRTWQVDIRNCKMADQEQIEQWARTRGEDSDFFKVRVAGEFPGLGEAQFISWDVIREAVKRESFSGDERILGLDVAAGGESMSAMACRNGSRLEWIRTWNYSDLMALTNAVANILAQVKYRACFVDAIGVGAGVYDRLRELGYPHLYPVRWGEPASDPGQFANQRAEAWWRLKEWLRTADIPEDPALLEELASMCTRPDPKGRVALESKHKMAARGLRSPDRADALALTFSIVLPSQSLLRYLPKQERAITEYDALTYQPERREPHGWSVFQA